MSRPLAQRLVTIAVVAGSALFVLLQLQPSLLLSNTTPAGGDMGAHVWGPAYVRDHLLPHGRLTGWSPDWYAGFPAYTFYFPLPGLLIVLADLVLPYGIAFKLVTVLGVVSMPVAAWAFGRLAGMRFPAPPLLAVATVPFLFDRFHKIWGGNIASTLAGEFSFALALSLGLLFLGVLARGLETGRHRALAGVLLALTGLCHVIPTMFVLAGAGVLLLLRLDRRRIGFVAALGGVAAALAGFWLLPFFVRLPYTNDMGWERTNTYLSHLFPWLHQPDADFTAANTAHFRVVVGLAALGAAAALLLRRRPAVALVGMAAVTALAFRLLPRGRLWNARVLPFWYLCLYFLAAIAVAEVAIALGRLLRAPPAAADGPRQEEGDGEVQRASPGPVTAQDDRKSGWSLPAIPALLAPPLALGLTLLAVALPLQVVPGWFPAHTTDRSYLPDWIKWNYTGYERKASWTEYSDLVATMDDLPCGRAMWEYEPELDRLGTPMALMLLPYWTDGCIGSMEGLFFESSATTPYHFLNQSELSLNPSRAQRGLPYRSLDVAAGVAHLQLLGVRYYMVLSPEAQAQAQAHPDLELVATSGPWPVNYPSGLQYRTWEVYEVDQSRVVAPLSYEPVVMNGVRSAAEAWKNAAVAWYQDASRWDVPLAASGPGEWRRVRGADATPPRRPVRTARVSAIRVDDDRISFDVDRPGSPVLVKASYFPNWEAEGARGPWRVTPNLMVVVPTGRHVELHYGRTLPDLAGLALTLLGLAAAVVLARRPAVRFPVPPAGTQAGEGQGAGAGEADGAEEADVPPGRAPVPSSAPP